MELQTILGQYGEAFDRLERVYLYLNNALDGKDRADAMRAVIKCQSHIRASIAGLIAGKVLLPSKSWGLTLADFEPQVRGYFHGQSC